MAMPGARRDETGAARSWGRRAAIASALVIAAAILVGRLGRDEPEDGEHAPPAPRGSTEGPGETDASRETSAARPASGVRVRCVGISPRAGRPLARARVFLLLAPDAADPATGALAPREAETDGEGVAFFEGVGAGAVRVGAVAEGHFGSETALAHTGEGTLDATLELGALGRILGVVRSASGEPSAGCRVSVAAPGVGSEIARLLHPRDRAEASRGPRLTNDAGEFVLDALPHGVALVVLAEHDRDGRARRPLAPLSPGAEDRIEIGLEAGTHLVGRVPAFDSSAEAAAATTTVELYDMPLPNRRIGEQTDIPRADSSFSFLDVRPGKKRVNLLRREGRRFVVGFLDAEAVKGTTVDVGEIPILDSALAVVVHAEGVLDPSGRTAWLSVSVDRFEPELAIESFMTAVDLGEQIEIRGLRRGSLRLGADLLDAGRPMVGSTPVRDPDYAYARVDVEYDGADGRVDVLVPLRKDYVPPERRGDLLVTLGVPPDFPPEPFRVAVVLTERGIYRRHDQRVLTRKGTRFAGLAASSYEVVAFGEGRVSEAGPAVVEPGRTTEIELSPWSRPPAVRGRVIDPDGKPVPGATVALLLGASEGELPSFRGIFFAESDRAGQFVLESVPFRRGLVVEASAGGGVRSEPVPLDAAPADDLVLVLRP